MEEIKEVRRVKKEEMVWKRGKMGEVVLEGDIKEEMEKGKRGKGFKIEVLKVMGEGDGLM